MRSNMYREAKDKTVNLFVGCKYNCVYCKPSFQKMMKRQKHRCLKCYNYEPHFHPERLKRRPPKTKGKEFIFLCDCGDVSFMTPEQWEMLIEYVEKWNDRTFLIQSKNPLCFAPYSFPENVILGTTIETNWVHFSFSKYRNYWNISKAPLPVYRCQAMIMLKHPRKAVTVEPILDFDLHVLLTWIVKIWPEFVYVGYDNHKCYLPEPPLQKTLHLIEELEKEGIEVRTKNIRKAWYET